MLKFQSLDGLRLEDDFAQLLESTFSTRKPKRFFYFCRYNAKKIEESSILCIGSTAGAPGRKNTPATRPPRPVAWMPGDRITGLRPARAIVPGLPAG